MHLREHSLNLIVKFRPNHFISIHSSPEIGPNSQGKAPLRRLGFCLTYIWVTSKNSKIKYSTDGPLRKFKNLAKKLSDFD